MSEPIQRGNPPFTTTDAELALALITAGCRPANIEEGGPAIQNWTPETARNRWVRNRDGSQLRLLPLSPVTPEEFERAVMRAWELKIPGQITYCIVRDAIFEEAIKAWDAMVDEAAKADIQKRDPILPNLTTAQVMQVLYIRRCNKKPMEKMAFVRSPNLTLGKTKKTLHDIEGDTNGIVDNSIKEQRSYTVEGRGIKMWSLNLSNGRRAALGIPPKPKA